MSKKIKNGSEFISMTMPEDKPWLRNVYFGERDGTGKHAHLCLSGSAISAETWYARDINGNEIIKNGSRIVDNASQLLSDSVPNTLREFQHPEKPLFWNVGSLDSLFLLKRNI